MLARHIEAICGQLKIPDTTSSTGNGREELGDFDRIGEHSRRTYISPNKSAIASLDCTNRCVAALLEKLGE